jgi:hypothetical protein
MYTHTIKQTELLISEFTDNILCSVDILSMGSAGLFTHLPP